MPEQPVSDRLATAQFKVRVRARHKASGICNKNMLSWHCAYCLTNQAVAEIGALTKDLSDYRHAALSSDAALEQADLQIGALRAEHARLRAQLDAVKGKVTTTLVDEEYQALLRWRRVFLECEDVEPEKLRAPQNQLVCYAIADAMTLRDIDRFLSTEIPPEDNGKSARDNRPAFSQVDLDTATTPIHAEVEQLRAENERLKAGMLEIADGIEWTRCDGNIVAAHIREAIEAPRT